MPPYTHSQIYPLSLLASLPPLPRSPALPFQDEIAQRTMDELPNNIHYSYEYSTQALDMERTICKAMKGLSSAEFEGVLHPVFEEDEFKLILVGGVLGAGVGVVQLFALF